MIDIQIDSKVQWGAEAVGDGVTDDTTKFAAALAYVSSNGGGTIRLGEKTYLIKTAGNGFTIPANCRIIGVPGKTVLLLDNANASLTSPPYCGVFTIQGVSNVLLQDFVIKRKSALLVNTILIDDCSNITFKNLKFEGQMATYGGAALCHGIRYGNSGGDVTNVRDIVVDSCEFSGMAFSVYMMNDSTAHVNGFTVRNCLFHDNYADDVNFNAPNGQFINAIVVNNQFRNGLSTSNVGGFAIDLANVQQATITSNIISDYPYNAIHLEDRTSHVSITGNIINDSAKIDEGVIQIIAGTTFVTITGNTINQKNTTPSGTRQTTSAIYIGQGGGTVTPDRITITSNVFNLGAHWDGISAFSVPRIVITGNHFEGSGSGAWSGTYTGGANVAIDIVNGGPVAVSGNYCLGMNSFVKGNPSNFRTMSGSINGNTIEQCNCGMDLRPTGSCVVTSNYIVNCVDSILSGSNGVTTAAQAVIALNYAVGCVNPMQATYGNFWGNVAETQRLIALNCDTSLGINGFPVQGHYGSADKLPILADTDAQNDTRYYSTTKNKPVYKDGNGNVNDLY